MASIQTDANAILSRLPVLCQDEIQETARKSAWTLGHVLHPFGTPTTSLFFPLSGVVSLTIPVEDGHRVEVGLVGSDGMVGVGALLGNERNDLDAMAQVRGRAIELPVESISAELRRGPGSVCGPLRDLAAARDRSDCRMQPAPQRGAADRALAPPGGRSRGHERPGADPRIPGHDACCQACECDCRSRCFRSSRPYQCRARQVEPGRPRRPDRRCLRLLQGDLSGRSDLRLNRSGPNGTQPDAVSIQWPSLYAYQRSVP